MRLRSMLPTRPARLLSMCSITPWTRPGTMHPPHRVAITHSPATQLCRSASSYTLMKTDLDRLCLTCLPPALVLIPRTAPSMAPKCIQIPRILLLFRADLTLVLLNLSSKVKGTAHTPFADAATARLPKMERPLCSLAACGVVFVVAGRRRATCPVFPACI